MGPPPHAAQGDPLTSGVHARHELSRNLPRRDRGRTSDASRCGRAGRRRPDGDRAAFDELVQATYLDTYTLAFRLTGDEEDARDVVQESYLRAYRGLKRFRGDAQFTTWMYRITANCAATYLGQAQRDTATTS